MSLHGNSHRREKNLPLFLLHFSRASIINNSGNSPKLPFASCVCAFSRHPWSHLRRPCWQLESLLPPFPRMICVAFAPSYPRYVCMPCSSCSAIPSHCRPLLAQAGAARQNFPRGAPLAPRCPLQWPSGTCGCGAFEVRLVQLRN